MKFLINGRKWELNYCDKYSKELKELTEEQVSGITDYYHSKIYILNDLTKDFTIDTIYHELMHAFMFTYGYAQYENYNDENICDMIGAFGKELFTVAEEIIKEKNFE